MVASRMYNEDEVEAEVTKMLRDLEDKARRLNQMSDREFDVLPKFFDDAEEYIFDVIDSYDKSGRKMAGSQYEVVLAELGRLQDAYNEALYRRSLYGNPEGVREMFPEKRPVLMSPMRGEQSFSSSYTKQPKMSSSSSSRGPIKEPKPLGLYVTNWDHTTKDGKVTERQTIYYSDGRGGGGFVSREKAAALHAGGSGVPRYDKRGDGTRYTGERKPISRTLYDGHGMRYSTNDLQAIEDYSRGREFAKRATLVPAGELKAVAHKYGLSSRVVSDIVRDMDAVGYAELDAYRGAGKKGVRGLRYSQYAPTRPSNGKRYRTPQQVYGGFQFEPERKPRKALF